MKVADRRARLTLIQILLLIAAVGALLLIGVPFWAERYGVDMDEIEPELDSVGDEVE